MKTLKQHIFEKLKVSSKRNACTLFPETKEELRQIIENEISKNGIGCSLNHIDVSRIIDMSRLFFGSKFNGDISKWDVSNVTDMSNMFSHSRFNGDISNLDVSNVNGMYGIFSHSPLENNPPKWFKM